MLSDAVGAFIEKSTGHGAWPFPPGHAVRVEVDGKYAGVVVFGSFEINADGDTCLMLFKDRTLAAHIASGQGHDIPLAASAVGPEC